MRIFSMNSLFAQMSLEQMIGEVSSSFIISHGRDSLTRVRYLYHLSKDPPFTRAKFSKIHFFKVAFKAICNKLLYTLITFFYYTNVMELTNIEIETIWLQPLLCTDKCLKKIYCWLSSINGNLPRVPIRLMVCLD